MGLIVLDGAATTQTLKTTLESSQHIPHHIVDRTVSVSGADPTTAPVRVSGDMYYNGGLITSAHPLPVTGYIGITGSLPAGTNNIGDVDIISMPDVTQSTHDNLNANANIQIGNIDASVANPLPVSGMKNIIDSNNSTTTPLAGDAVYTGTSVDVLGYASLSVQIEADVDSAANGMSFQFSQDNSNWQVMHNHFFDFSENPARVFQFTCHARYFRFVYTNGTGAQSVFRVQTILHEFPISTTSIRRLDDTETPDRSATIVKSVLVARSAGMGNFIPIDATAGGNLKVAVEEFDADVVSATHDNFNVNANLQIGDADVSITNPVAVTGSVGIQGSLPAGTNNIGDVDVLTMPEVNVNIQDGGGTDLTSTTVGADRALDVNIVQTVGAAGTNEQYGRNRVHPNPTGIAQLGYDGTTLRTLLTDTNGRLSVDINSGGGGGEQYGNANTHPNPTGTVMLYRNDQTFHIPSGSTDGRLATSGIITEIVPGTSAINLGKAIDSPVGATDVGVALLAKHEGDTLHLTSADGDYDLVRMSEFGALHVEPEQHHVIDEMDSVTGWAALSNDTINLGLTTTHVLGDGALTFDKTDGLANTIFGGIEKTLSTINFGGLSPHDILQTIFYASDVSNVSYIFLRLGDNSSNYNEWRIDGAELTGGIWENVIFEVGDASFDGATGTGVDWTDVTYCAVGLAFNAEANALAGIIFDEISFHTNQHVNASINSEVSSSVNSANINILKVGSKVVNTEAGNVGTGTQRITIATDDVNLAAIKTAIEALDNIVAGSAATVVQTTHDNLNLNANIQVGDTDVSTTNPVPVTGEVAIRDSLPAGTNNIGDVDIASIAAGDNNIGNVDIVTLPAGNLGQRASAASLSITPATDIADATYVGDIKFGESLPAGTNNIGDVDVLTLPALVAGSASIGSMTIDNVQFGDGTAHPNPTGLHILGHDGSNFRSILTDSNGRLSVDINSGGSGGEQYGRGTAHPNPTGTLAMGWDGTNIQAFLASSERHIGVSGIVDVTPNAPVPTDYLPVRLSDGIDWLGGATTFGDGVAHPNPTGLMVMGYDGTAARIITTDTDGDIQVDIKTIPETNVNLQDGAGTDLTSTSINSNQTLDTNVGGDIAHGVADAANPIKIGGKASTDIAAADAVADAERTDAIFTTLGYQVVNPYTIPEEIVYGTGTLTGTSNHALIQAPGANLRNYITSVSASNTNAATGVRIDFKNNAAPVLSFYLAPAGGGASHTMPVPIRCDTNVAFQAALSITLSSTYASAQGFVGV